MTTITLCGVCGRAFFTGKDLDTHLKQAHARNTNPVNTHHFTRQGTERKRQPARGVQAPLLETGD